MNRSPDQKRLLAEVLAESPPRDFRATLLGETLRQVGRRRRLRQARHLTVILAVLVLSGFWILRDFPQRASLPTAPAAVASYEAVRTQPLLADAIIHTQPLEADQIVTSVPNTSFVSTATESRAYRIINDAELLALAGPRSAALVRIGPNAEKLIFTDPNDQTIIH